MLGKLELIAGWVDVDLLGAERKGLLLTVVDPRDDGLVDVDVGVLGDIDYLRIFLIDSVAVGVDIDTVTKKRHGLFEGVETILFVGVELTDDVVGHDGAREGDSTACVLLLGETEEVGGVVDFRLNLLLGVAEVVVSDKCYDDTACIACCDLERAAIVVELVLVAPPSERWRSVAWS